MKHVTNSITPPSSVFLNLIRFGASEMVVICHFLTKYQPAVGQPSFRLGSTMGGVAVLMFFALSGMLICYSVLNKLGNPKYRFRHFFVDRFSRIYSGLIPALLIGGFFAVVIYVTNYSYFVSLSTMQSTPSPLTFGMTLGMLERFPVDFFNSLLSPLGLVVSLPSVTPFGFNGVLWTLAVEWWIYMVFGWFVIGALAFVGKRDRSKAYKVGFFVVAAVLGLVLAGLMQEFSSFIIVWFAGASMMLVISNGTVKNWISRDLARNVLMLLLFLALAGALAFAYTAFAWTSQYYDVLLGIPLASFILLGVLFLNGNQTGKAAKWLQHKHVFNWVTVGAGFSYTLFLTHYPIVIFLNGLNLPVDRSLMFVPILLLANSVAFSVAYFTEKRHRSLAVALKKRLGLQC